MQIRGLGRRNLHKPDTSDTPSTNRISKGFESYPTRHITQHTVNTTRHNLPNIAASESLIISQSVKG